MNEKEALVEELKGELTTYKSTPMKEEENPPSLIKELESIKDRVKLYVKKKRKGHEQPLLEPNTFLKHEKVEKAEEWIENAKKGKDMMHETTLTSHIINMTIEEEQRRKTRALHECVIGLKDNGKVEEEVKELLEHMVISEFTHAVAQRVGNKGITRK